MDSADSKIEGALALTLAVVVGMRVDVRYGLELGPLVALVLAPAWLTHVRRGRGGTTLMALLGAGAISGVVISIIHADSGTSSALMIERTAILLSVAGGVGALVWARHHHGPARMAVAVGVGLVTGIPLNLSDDPNQWRFTYSIPVIVLVLALVSAYRGPWRVALQAIACVALAGVGLMNDSRSNSAMLLLAAVAIVWHAIDHVARRGRGGVYLLVAWAVASFLLVQTAILGGVFGQATQSRTEAQIVQSGGSVLLGGRPELAASLELIRQHPEGLGSGTLATYDVVMSAKDAMDAIGYDPNNGYVERFMFGNGVELHSGIGDYWIWFGPVGLGVVVLYLFITFTGVRALYESAALTVLAAYLGTRVVWDVAFSPAASSVTLLVLALALLMRPSSAPDPPRQGHDRPLRRGVEVLTGRDAQNEGAKPQRRS